MEECSDRLDDLGKDYLNRVLLAARRMAALIDDLLNLSRVTRAEIAREELDFTELGHSIASELRRVDPKRKVEFVIAPDLRAEGDPRLLRTVLENLMGNCWKFTSNRNMPGSNLAKLRSTTPAPFSFAIMALVSTKNMWTGYLERFSACTPPTNFRELELVLLPPNESFSATEGASGRKERVGRGATFYFTLFAPRKAAEAQQQEQPPEGEGIEDAEANNLVGRR